ncbi:MULTISPECIES: hypothetical protein [unclassified Sulfurospirillum]|uniref:hypothetical protein n=1 Tax=unclassified Sulfurospirillum TaxID=2618290 RepID=UPI000503AEDD|nr:MULTISPECIES: hypothetical protein [unclassified Sulfurospirillum]KFL34971.1 hypothetical protein JU57_03100 [Sulfurospirillum sp. SCADC]
MHPSLQNITAITIIIAGLILGVTTFDTYLYNYHTKEATQIILKTMAKECQMIKEREGLDDSFEQTSMAVDQMLGQGNHTLTQESYLELISLCVVMQKNKVKI